MNVVRTAARGPRPVATPEQIERVLALDAAGSSLREIALAVFGDRALYGRVRRLLHSTRPKTTGEQAADRAVAATLVGLHDDDAALEELDALVHSAIGPSTLNACDAAASGRGSRSGWS